MAISNSDDIIDSRDVIERIKELEHDAEAARDAAQELVDALAVLEANPKTTKKYEKELTAAGEALFRTWIARDGCRYMDDFSEDEYNELEALKALESEAEGYSVDWRHGETLIHDSYFQKYAEQLAEDIGAIDRNSKWPLNNIDWEAAANELQQDYTSVDFDGETFWMRS